LECWEPSQHLLIDTGKPRKTCLIISSAERQVIKDLSKDFPADCCHVLSLVGRNSLQLYRSCQFPGVFVIGGPVCGCFCVAVHPPCVTNWHCATALGRGTMRQAQFAADCCHVISNIFTVCVCVCVCVGAVFHPKPNQCVPKGRNFYCSPLLTAKAVPYLTLPQARSITL